MDIYDISGYGAMIADRARLDAYAEALRRSVQPGDVVVDIGTGPGILALLACRLGARRVYALDPAGVIQLGREIARANGLADRIEFIDDPSTRVSLPERAAVVVSDLRGVLPLFQRHIPSIIDARQRFLAPGGRLVPERDELWIAAVEARETYEQLLAPWTDAPLSLDLRAARRLLVNSWRRVRLAPEQLATSPRRWAALDYATVESPNVAATLELEAERRATAHGLLVWFDTRLAAGVGFSNAPGAPELIYAAAFFPWPEAVELRPGDVVSVRLDARLVGDEYVWRWDSDVPGRDGDASLRRFEQSTFFGVPLARGRLRRRDGEHVPSLDVEGRIVRRALELMDGSASLSQIAARLAAEFPERFASPADALARVGDLSAEFGQ